MVVSKVWFSVSRSIELLRELRGSRRYVAALSLNISFINHLVTFQITTFYLTTNKTCFVNIVFKSMIMHIYHQLLFIIDLGNVILLQCQPKCKRITTMSCLHYNKIKTSVLTGIRNGYF